MVERGGQNQPASQWNEPPRATSLKRILRNRRCSLSSSASLSSLWWSSRGRVRSRRSLWSTWIWSRDAPCDGNWWNVTNGSLHRPPRLRNWNDTRFLCFLLFVRLNVSTNGFEYQDHGCNISRLPFWMLGEVVLHRTLVARSCSHLREIEVTLIV